MRSRETPDIDIENYVWPADELARLKACMANPMTPKPADETPGIGHNGAPETEDPPSFDDVVAENLRRGLYLSQRDALIRTFYFANAHVPRLAMRSCQAMIGVPSTLWRRAILLLAACDGSAGCTMDDRSRLFGSWSANRSGASATRMWCSMQYASMHRNTWVLVFLR
jgi:hypothetical protein